MTNISSVPITKLTWSLFFFLTFILFLDSFHVYLFWSIPYVVPSVVTIFAFLFVLSKPHYFIFSKRNLIPFILFFITLLFTKRDQNIYGYIASIISFISVLLFFILKKYYKAKFIETLTKTLSVILAISLVAWFLVLIGVHLPNTPIYYKSGGEIYQLTSYYFFIEYTFDSIVFQRFMSIFIEPGYLATLLAILIFINNFQLKRLEILILFIALICTFSIAGYLMLTVAYISFLVKNKKYAITYLVLFSILVLVSYNIGTQVNQGNNAFNELVIQRLSIDSNGRMIGYNRTSSDMDQMFIEFIKSDDVLTGIGDDFKPYEANVGFKPFIVINGIIGLTLLLISYFSGWLLNKSVFSLTISMLFIMIFIKGHSEIFWAGYLMVYATSIYLPQNWRALYLLKKNELK